jgi:branched-chain amino acid aminotransferase
MAFSLDLHPFAYRALLQGNGTWKEEYVEQSHKSAAEEAAMNPDKLAEMNGRRNMWPDMPLVSYTTQYGLGCFEGLKAMPQKNGGLAIFRPDQNAARFRRSMEGLLMPGFPEDKFLKAVVEVVKRNEKLGFTLKYDPAWEKDNFSQASSIYLRPFSYAEGGIGVNASTHPYVIVVANPVSAYFSGGNSKAITTDRIRATPRGTGWIKADSNYVMSMLAKKEANHAGYMEVVFLDAKEGKYIQEGSSCNFFAYLKSGELVTPDLGDTILPGITRKSVLELARDKGVKTAERPLSIEEVMSEAKECFVTGTAAGITTLESVTHKGKEAVFNDRKPGELSLELQKTLKGIQYGALPDTKGWMVKV